MEYKIYNEDCFETMKRLDDGCIDIILTSPFYNTNKKAGKSRTLANTSVKNGTLTIKDLENVNSLAKTYLQTYAPFYPTRKNYKYIFYIYEVTYKLDQ